MNKETLLIPGTLISEKFEHEGRQFEFVCCYAGDYIYGQGMDRIWVNRATGKVQLSYKFKVAT